MPKIPQSNIQTVTPTALNPAPASQRAISTIANTGSIVAGTASKVAADLAQMGIMQARKTAATSKLKASNELGEFSRELEHGENGFTRAKGQNALIREQEVLSDFEGRRNAIAAEIANERTREAWVAETEGFFNDFRRRAAMHSAGEQDKMAAGEFKTQQALATQDALSALDNFDAHPDTAIPDFALSVARYEDVVSKRAFEMGMTNDAGTGLSEEAKLNIATWKSGVMTAGIDSLIEQKKGAVASDLFDVAVEQGALLPSDAMKIEHRLQPAKDLERASMQVSGMFEGIDKMYTPQQYEDVMAEINEESDPVVRGYMLSDAKERFSTFTGIRTAFESETMGRYMTDVENEVPISTVEQRYDFGQLDWRMQQTLRNRASQIATKTIPRTTTAAIIEWEYVVDRAEDGSITGYRKRTDKEKADYELIRLKDVLSPADFESKHKEQRELERNNGEKPAILNVFQELDRRIDNWVVDGGQGKGHEIDLGMYAHIKGRVKDLAEAKISDGRKSKTLSAPERDEILNEALAPLMFGKKKYPAALGTYSEEVGGPFDEEALREISVPAAMIPIEEREGLEEYVQKHIVGPEQEFNDQILEDVYGQIRAGRDPSGRRFIDRYNTEQADAEIRDFQVIANDLIVSGELPEGTSPSFARSVVETMRGMDGWDVNDPVMMNNAMDLIRASTAEAFNYAIRNEEHDPTHRNIPDYYKKSIDESIRLYHEIRRNDGLTAQEAREQLGIPIPLSMFTPQQKVGEAGPGTPWSTGPVNTPGKPASSGSE